MRLISVVLCSLLMGCATLTKVGGSTGDLDLGKGYVCSATLGVVDDKTCTREITTHCTGPKGFVNDTRTVAPASRNSEGVCQ
jgi:hypothetical protein